MAKTESKGKAAGNALLPAVSPEKIVKGMTTIFQGFSIMFDGMAEHMELASGMAGQLPGASAPSNKSTGKDVSVGDNEPAGNAPSEKVDTGQTGNKGPAASGEAQDIEEDTPPWEEQKSGSADAVPSVTQDDISRVIVAKIKQKRDNNAKIGKLLKAYGVSLLSELPQEKYEAFLNDISRL